MSERCSIRVAWTGDRSDTPSTSSVGCRSMGSCGASKPFRREKILTEWRNYLYTLYQYNTCNYAPNNPFVSPLEINGQGVPYYMWCMFLEGHNDSKSRYICRHDPPKQKKNILLCLLWEAQNSDKRLSCQTIRINMHPAHWWKKSYAGA